jgi:uncharacterized protein YdiU (UPF0061 family)
MLLGAMRDTGADFTNSFRALAEGEALPVVAEDAGAFAPFLDAWAARLAEEGSTADAARARMQAANPAIIPRNHRVEAALVAATAGDLAPFGRLLEAVRRPFAPLPEDTPFRLPPLPEERVQATFCGT